ncbi:1-deoxy-D-xylulose-5-phosphate reductoisomerase [soil metagenome]
MPESELRDQHVRGVAVLGSTGSIGSQALDVLEALGDRFRVVALAAGRNAALLAAQAGRIRPEVAYLAGKDGKSSADTLAEIATRADVDVVLVATGGMVSLRPVIAALDAGKVVATANKETLVAGGHLVMPLARRLAATDGMAGNASAALAWLRPIDSEHSAIWQCLAGERRDDVKRLVLTASGGPFREWPTERLAAVTPEQALAHPTWRMGAKITIDSATLMNKGLEVLEARWLYDVADAAVDVVIHPQSVIHSLVEFADGSLKAQLGLPDMRIPIQFALTYPAHLPSPVPAVDLVDLPALTFEALDEQRFGAVALARRAGGQGQRAAAALICADEVAVRRFLDGTLDFGGIVALCATATERFGGGADPTLDELIDLEREVREWAATAQPDGAS